MENSAICVLISDNAAPFSALIASRAEVITFSASTFAVAFESQSLLGKFTFYALGFAKSKAYDGKADDIANNYAVAYESQRLIGKSIDYSNVFARSKVYYGHSDETATTFSLLIES